MHVINARNVHTALPMGVDLILALGRQRKNRNSETLSDVLQYNGPLTTVYEHPTERVIFWPERDANPFFHLFESLWMLAGRNDVAFPTRFVKNFGQFSDDGKTFNGAYGFRWRAFFGGDQLNAVTKMLRDDPDTRRAYVGMWDPAHDLGSSSKDIPCNVGIHFMVNLDGQLDMTVFNRSNDMVFGAYGANAVHMSILQEYVATGCGRPVGRYWQVSNNFHAYLKTLEPVKPLRHVLDSWMYTKPVCPYAHGTVQPFPLMSVDYDTWNEDLLMFFDDPTAIGFRDPFFRKVAVPMYAAFEQWQIELPLEERVQRTFEILRNCVASDWRLAAEEWVMRRYERAKQRKGNDNAEAA